MSKKGAGVTWAEDLTGASQEPVSIKYRAKRYAVKFDPPCIFLEYEDETSQRRVRAVKLNKIDPTIDVDRLTRKIIRSFPRKLDATTIKYGQIRKLVAKVVERVQQQKQVAGSTQSLESGTSESSFEASSRASASARARLLSQLGEPGSSRDSTEGFDTYSTSAGSDDEHGAQLAEDNDLDTALSELNQELGDLTNLKSPTISSGFSTGSRLKSVGTHDVEHDHGNDGDVDNDKEPGVVERLLREPVVDVNGDLNACTDVELKLAKLLMEKDFQKNLLKPGDEGFVYDKQVEFVPTSDNEWDDDSDGDVSVREGTSRDISIDWNDIAAKTKGMAPI